MASPYQRTARESLPPLQAPFVIRCYDKLGRRQGWLGDPSDVRVTLRDIELSTATVTLPLDHPLAVVLSIPGARVEIDLDEEREDPYLMGGWASNPRTTGGPASMLTVDVLDDKVIWRDLLGFPVPSAPLSAQVKEYDVRRATVEGAVKSLISAAVARSGVGVQIAANLGRGPSTVISARMGPLEDYVVPLLQRHNFMVTVRPTGTEQQRTGILLDVVPRPVYPHTLSEESGEVITGTTERTDPTVTRVVVGGGGEGALRDFRGWYVDTARESTWRRRIEGFVDARDARSDLDAAVRDRDQAAGKAKDAARDLRDARSDRGIAIGAARADVIEAQAGVDYRNVAQYEDGTSPTDAQQQAAADKLTQAQQRLATVTAEQDAKVAAAVAAQTAALAEQSAAAAVVTTEAAAYETELDQRGADALAEGAPSASVAVTIAETATLRYGRDGFVVGALLPIDTSGLPVVERLRAVDLSWTPEDGYRVTSNVGDRPTEDGTSIDRLVTSIQSLTIRVARQAARLRASARR